MDGHLLWEVDLKRLYENLTHSLLTKTFHLELLFHCYMPTNCALQWIMKQCLVWMHGSRMKDGLQVRCLCIMLHISSALLGDQKGLKNMPIDS